MSETNVTNEKLIRFYTHAKEHYPVSDLFMQNYRQKKDGYISLYDVFISSEHGKVDGKPDSDDRVFYLILRDYWEQKPECKELDWLQELSDEFVFCEGDHQYRVLEPNQKWHFLVAWGAYSLLGDVVAERLKKDKLDGAKARKITEPAFKDSGLGNGVRCPELLLWMLEAAVDGENVTLYDVLECYTDAVAYRCGGKFTPSKYWKKIEMRLANAVNRRRPHARQST